MAKLGSQSETHASPGFLQSLKTFLGTWVDLLRTRLDLFTTELQEERLRLQELVVLGLAALLCLSFGVLLVTLFVVVIFWESNYRLLVLGGFAVLYLAAGVAAGMAARRKARNRPKLFSQTLAELAKDYQHLSS